MLFEFSLIKMGCKASKSDHSHGHGHGSGSGDHQSTVVALGTIQIDDTPFTIDREGQFTLTSLLKCSTH